MSANSVQCQMCKTVVSAKDCIFANYEHVIDGKKYVFCCLRCYNEYGKKNQKKG